MHNQEVQCDYQYRDGLTTPPMHVAICGGSSAYVCIVWISLKTLCSEVLATFADQLSFLRFLTDFQWKKKKQTVMASFQDG